MTVEDHLKMMLGNKDFQIAVLAAQLDEANKKIAELEKKEEKPPEG